jgi:hypothetical protein
MEMPQPGEGYDKLISLTLDQQPPAGYTSEDVLAILQRLRDSPSVRVNDAHSTQGTIQPPQNQTDDNSRSRGGGRGRSRGRHRKRRGFPLGTTSEHRNRHGVD